MGISDAARAAAAWAKLSTVRKSVPAGKCGPCCSVAPSGSTTVVSEAMARCSTRVISAKSRRVGFIDSGFAGVLPDYIPVKLYTETWAVGRREIATGNGNRLLHDIPHVTDGSEAFTRVRQVRN